jgi:hypothetical protein
MRLARGRQYWTLQKSLVNQLFEIELSDPDVTSFYVPKVVLPPDARQDFMVFDRRRHVAEWITLPFAL